MVAEEILTTARRIRRRLLSHQEDIRSMLAKNVTELRDVDETISETEAMLHGFDTH